MAVEQIIKEIKQLDCDDKARLLRFLEAELIEEDPNNEDLMEDFIGSIKNYQRHLKGQQVMRKIYTAAPPVFNYLLNL
ncbi:hypothetical protein [Neomoorella mulderi]|uniref:Uncharacterized protein n=1 Tax=Moorella mulderi DSM 14980 TaxID=1122241 RepID=A0A151AYH0_9FIRM|nr:hypothetical protein [Moorella mulderi]KYH32681.1 hypothetical protein MOMUL_12830 [Moorella mulderi DSM 14980]